MSSQEDLASLIDTFLSGGDQSTRLVGEIERVIVSHYLDSDVYEILAEAVSLYRPGDGAPYIDADDMQHPLREARLMLAR